MATLVSRKAFPRFILLTIGIALLQPAAVVGQQMADASPMDSGAGALPEVQPAPAENAIPSDPDRPKLQDRTGAIADVRYRVGPGDVLGVQVFNRPNLSRDSVRVDGDGMIRLPLLNAIKAACLTESELADTISRGYSEYLKEPQVEVFMKEFSSQPVVVNGSVAKPGTFQLQRRVRLREMLILAGGPTANAGPAVQIVHDESVALCQPSAPAGAHPAAANDAEFIPIRDLLQAGGAANPYVRPGDFINVPEANIAYVVGNVYRPTPVSLGSRVTVSRAIAIAGGALPNSKGQIRLLRASSGGGSTRELFFNLKQLQNQEAEDVALAPGDIVEVRLSEVKVLLKTILTFVVGNGASSAVVATTVNGVK